MRQGRRTTGSSANPRGPRRGAIGSERVKSPTDVVSRRPIGAEAIYSTLADRQVLTSIELRIFAESAGIQMLEEALAAMADEYTNALDYAIDSGCLVEILEAYRNGEIDQFMEAMYEQ